MTRIVKKFSNFLKLFPKTCSDSEPVVNPEKFTLYDMPYCPFCQRVRYTLDYHQIPYDRILINLVSKPDWYLQLHPQGKVPLLRYRGDKLTESDLIMRFVDQFKGKESSLLSVCDETAFKEALELASTIAGPRYTVSYSKDATRAHAEALKAALTKLNDTIKGPHLLGEKLSLADLAVFPFLNAWNYVMSRLVRLEGDSAGDTTDSISAQWPRITEYRRHMNSNPWVTVNGFSDEDYLNFVEAYLSK